MKILMLTSSFDIGGAETHILELSKSLTQKGHTVALVSGGGDYVKALKQYNIPHFLIPLNSKNPLHLLSAYKKLKAILTTTYLIASF